jgi:CheY-like chemotaxis protein
MKQADDDSTMGADERDICIYLESCPGQLVSGIEIAKRAGGKKRHRENPNWAVQPLLHLVEAALIETDANNHYRLKPTEKAVPPDAGPSKSVLYVDDDKDWLDVVGTSLQEAGYEVQTANNATQALVLTEGAQFGLILLDLDLDGENGLVLMKYFQRNQPDVPIILYTGLNHDDDAILEMLREGAHQYVRKGPLEDLHKAVEMALR